MEIRLSVVIYGMYTCAGLAALKLRSQAIQRGAVRPGEVNGSVVRGPAAQAGQGGQGGALSALQQAEELLKHEMLTMLHYDALRDPPPGTYASYIFHPSVFRKRL